MIFRQLIFCFIIFISLITNVWADETARTFLDGIKYYKENDFEKAIAAFSKAADAGIKNSKLFYNLGNAYLKSDDLGHAILWYERALKLSPDDPDLKFNYEYALSLVKDEKEDKISPVFKVLFFWKHLFSAQMIQQAAIIFNVIFWLILTFQVLRRKKTFRTLNYLILILALVFMLTAFYNYYETHYIRQGIILPSEVSVRSGLTDASTELFVLHAGTKIKIEKNHQDFYRIYFSEGKIGWVKKSDVGII